MININKKIEEIRQKPEHERLRYVWGAVAVCMVFVFLIWLLSVKISLQKNASQPQTQNLPDVGQQLQDIKNAAPSINDINKITNQDTSGQYQQGVTTTPDNSSQPAQ